MKRTARNKLVPQGQEIDSTEGSALKKNKLYLKVIKIDLINEGTQ